MSGLEIIEQYQIPDKPDFYATTSHRFKLDLFDFFNDYKDKVLIEFGTSRGYTSVFCSIFLHKICFKDQNNFCFG